MENMRYGQTVPKLTHEECMDLMWEVLSDVELHRKAALGYKKSGQRIDLYGREDNQIVREAAAFWNAETTDGHPNMRSNISADIAEVEEYFVAGNIAWSKYKVTLTESWMSLGSAWAAVLPSRIMKQASARECKCALLSLSSDVSPATLLLLLLLLLVSVPLPLTSVRVP